MRFVLFNFVVAAALIYLVTGGSPETLTAIGVPETVVDAIEEVKGKASDPKKQPIKKLKEVAVIPDQIDPKSQVEPEPFVAPIRKPLTFKTQEAKLPPLAEPRWVPETKTLKPDETLTATRPGTKPRIKPRIKPKEKLAPEVKRRRAEIFGITDKASAKVAPKPKKTYAVKAGEKLMSPSQRRRELRALVEDMELLYLDKAGG
jgi:hypothetical protein